MPLLGKQSREVLPPIKNPAFSLTEENAVTISDNNQQQTSSHLQVSLILIVLSLKLSRPVSRLNP